MHHSAVLSDGRAVTAELVNHVIEAELAKARASVDDARYKAYERAAAMLRDLIGSDTFTEFLTLPAYQAVLQEE